MPKNETGEFELVLGNRQLLSGFAVVAILFGVFFAMGYIVGRNSTPSARAADMPASQPAGGLGQPDAGRALNQPPAQQTPIPAPEGSAPPAPMPAVAEPTPQPTRPPEAAKPAERVAEPAAPSVQSADSLQSGTY